MKAYMKDMEMITASEARDNANKFAVESKSKQDEERMIKLHFQRSKVDEAIRKASKNGGTSTTLRNFYPLDEILEEIAEVGYSSKLSDDGYAYSFTVYWD